MTDHINTISLGMLVTVPSVQVSRNLRMSIEHALKLSPMSLLTSI